ncbi:nibrin [Megachile rotundata]|uniref:nibrin n=1 Tax=Megachile rotundata TaxID=143995 RepID=UPI003FD56BEA
MWYLLKPNGERIYLKPFEELTFGRKNAQILIVNDDSISRTHASICVQPKNDTKLDEPTSSCIVKDKGSKYGTYVITNDEKTEVTEEGYVLNDQNIIRFGLQKATFTVVYLPIITVVSTLSIEDKSSLQNLMDHIDGIISTEWTNHCTHLTVSKATLTEKVTWALASAIPIVTINYWTEVNEAISRNEVLPEPDKYIPLIGESLIDKEKLLLCPNKKRKTLFQNFIFVHFSINQYKIYGKMIHLAGGKSVLYSKKPLTPKELCFPNVVVLQYPGDESTQSTQHFVPDYDLICKTLHEHRRKMIPESEIPLAILHSSVDKYCNPTFRFSEFLKRSEPKPDTSEVIVIDTQDITPVKSNIPKSRTPHIIPETNDAFSQDLLSSRLVDRATQERPCSSSMRNDKLKTNVSAPKDTEQNEKVEHSRGSAVFIPETYESFVSNVPSMDVFSSTPHTANLRRDKDIENNKPSKSSTEVINKLPIKEVIDISEDDDMFEKVQSNTNKVNERPNKEKEKEKVQRVESQKTHNASKTNVDAKSKRPLTNTKNIMKERTIVVSSSDDDSLHSDEDKSAKGNTAESYISNYDSDEEEESFSNKCNSRNNTDESVNYQSNSEPSSSKKRRLSQNLSAERINETSSCTIRNEDSSSNSADVSRSSTINYKRFKKAPVTIPKKRISLDDMCVWQKFSA